MAAITQPSACRVLNSVTGSFARRTLNAPTDAAATSTRTMASSSVRLVAAEVEVAQMAVAEPRCTVDLAVARTTMMSPGQPAAGWGSLKPETSGYPYCTSFDSSKYKRLNEYGTNEIVAIDRKVLAANRATMCGKQIQVFKNGVEVPGPFVVFDGCEACEGGGRIDFSLTALNQIDNGNACQSGVVPGISWKVTNTQIIPFIP